MYDLGTFLDSEYGICVEEKIIANTFRADDLSFVSNSEKMQKQLDGLRKFCSLNNMMSVNEIKTMCMTVDSKGTNLTFNDNEMERVTQYKCLVVIAKSIRKHTRSGTYFREKCPLKWWDHICLMLKKLNSAYIDLSLILNFYRKCFFFFSTQQYQPRNRPVKSTPLWRKTICNCT